MMNAKQLSPSVSNLLLCGCFVSLWRVSSTTINFTDVMVYEVSRHFWKLAVSAGSVLVFCYASLMPVGASTRLLQHI
jgi:hypothetical protein